MPPRKRAKVVHEESEEAAQVDTVASKKIGSKRRTKKPKPAPIMQIPRDIFEEIAKYLSTEDLLHLARTSRPWRTILMSKASKRIWVAAREMFQMPYCPVDLSEPQLADLLFGKGCTICCTSRTCKDPLFELRVRVCSACMKSQVVSRNKLYEKHQFSQVEWHMLEDLLPHVWLTRNTSKGFYVLKSQCEAVLQKMRSLSLGSEERAAFVVERKAATDAVLKSVPDMRTWYNNALMEKKRRDLEARKSRRASILSRLTALGYSGDDFDTRFDGCGWKWMVFFDKATSLTEKAWKAMEPQLVATIKLRREHTPDKFKQYRRSVRQIELKNRLSNFRPQLQHITMHKLFLAADFLDLPVVKEVVEENDCRIPVTDARWLLVKIILPGAVEAHAKKIERDCVEVMDPAIGDAMNLGKERWWETERREWEEREAEREREREAQENDFDASDEEVDDPHPDDRHYEELPGGLEDVEMEYCFDDSDSGVEDADFVHPRLLSARSLFVQDINGVKRVRSYEEILRRRVLKIFPPSYTYLSDASVPWCKEKITSSGQLVDIAVILLKCLKLPVETRMAYMAGCNDSFRCNRCSDGTASRVMTWPELVEHFNNKYIKFYDSCSKYREQKSGPPPVNDHSLEEHDYHSKGVPVSMPRGLGNVEGGPLTDTGHRYSEMVDGWGFGPGHDMDSESDDDDFGDSDMSDDPGDFDDDYFYNAFW